VSAGIPVAALDAASEADAEKALFHCCGIRSWAKAMTAARPFKSEAALLAAAETAWSRCGEAEWLEAFKQHPKIGDLDSLRKRFAATAALAGAEQAGVATASEETLAALAEGNRLYEAKFGYIFIVCATGKSADAMRRLLEARLHNDPRQELAIAAQEQKQITRLRLAKIALPEAPT
jgi:2-oxo-4-hydroxy-4-carboxy-5-ureidoimidazoline decarboxylase